MKSPKTTSPTTVPLNGQIPWLEQLNAWQNDPVMQMIQPKGTPQYYGNEDFEMGESTIHLITAGILIYGLGFHFAASSGFRVFGNLNLHFSDEDPAAYVSPDVMVVRAKRALPTKLSSYRIGKEGPAPLMVGEVFSFRTWQQGDTDRKPKLYSRLGVEEYLLVDVTGEMLDKRLLLLRRQPDGSWRDEQDADGGITSRLGFRVVIADDGQLRLIDVQTGNPYPRPEEALELANKVRLLEKELARLRTDSPKQQKGKARKRQS